MIFISLIATILFHFFLFRKRGLIDPISIFLIAYLYYNYFTPVLMVLFNEFDFNILEKVMSINEEIIDQLSILSFLSYAGYSTGYYFATKSFDSHKYPPLNTSISVIFKDTYFKTFGITALVIFFIIIVFFNAEILGATSDYASKTELTYNNPTYSFLLSLTLTLMSLLSNYIILNVRRYLIITVVAVLLFLVIAFATFSKGPFIYAALCGFCFLHRYRSLPSPFMLAVINVAGILALFYFVPIFMAYRVSGEISLIPTDQLSLSTIFSDAIGPYSVIYFALSGFIQTEGYPLWHSLVLWIPRAIWQDRPLDIAEGFARHVMLDWQPGYGLGFSPLADAYARAGMWGAPFLMLLLGAIAGMMQRLFSLFLPEHIRIPAILTVSGFLAVLTLRGPFSGLITPCIQLWIPLLLVGVMANEIAKLPQASR